MIVVQVKIDCQPTTVNQQLIKMAETLTKKVVAEPLFGKKEKKLITDPLNDNNPITVQVLGICSALAVTSLLYPSIVISIAVVFVLSLIHI